MLENKSNRLRRNTWKWEVKTFRVVGRTHFAPRPLQISPLCARAYAAEKDGAEAGAPKKKEKTGSVYGKCTFLKSYQSTLKQTERKKFSRLFSFALISAALPCTLMFVHQNQELSSVFTVLCLAQLDFIHLEFFHPRPAFCVRASVRLARHCLADGALERSIYFILPRPFLPPLSARRLFDCVVSRYHFYWK